MEGDDDDGLSPLSIVVLAIRSKPKGARQRCKRICMRNHKSYKTRKRPGVPLLFFLDYWLTGWCVGRSVGLFLARTQKKNTEHAAAQSPPWKQKKTWTAAPPPFVHPSNLSLLYPTTHPISSPPQSKTPPEYRLPLCYLMDSLLQNARAPYPGLFARYVVPMLCRTYEFVRACVRACVVEGRICASIEACGRSGRVALPPPRTGPRHLMYIHIPSISFFSFFLFLFGRGAPRTGSA